MYKKYLRNKSLDKKTDSKNEDKYALRKINFSIPNFISIFTESIRLH